MNGGGKLIGDSTWICKVRNLRLGDLIRCTNWNGEYWSGGEVRVVITPPEATGDRDGFYVFDVEPDDVSRSWLRLVIRPDDEVVIVTRDVREPTIKKPERAAQASLFGENDLDPYRR